MIRKKHCKFFIKFIIITNPPPHHDTSTGCIHKLQIAILSPLFAFCLIACSSNQPQYVDSRDYTSFGLDNHDIGDMLEKQVDSLLSQRIIKNQNEPKILVIGEINDETGQNIDIEIVTTEIMKHLSNSGKFVIVNAGSNANIEKIIRNSRKFRDDAEYNQYTTIEQGNLISPHYALTGKITEINKTIGDDEIVEYIFVLYFTDLKTGVHLWVGTERISKKLPKSEVSQSYIYSFTPSYGYTPRYSQDDDSDSWESVKEFFSFGAEGRNHFIFGADFGLGAVGINLPPVDFTIIEKTNYNSSPTTTPHSMWIDDDYYSPPFAMPINVRIGYLRDIGDNWAFGLNFLYNYMYVSAADEYGLEDTASSIEIESDSKKLTHTIQRIGGELLIYYKALDWLHIYVGGGALKDFGSKYKLSFEAYRSSYFDYSINTAGQKRFELERKIDSWYPLVKFGVLWNFNNYIGANSDVTCSWALKEENYLGVNCAFVLGLQLKI